MITAEKKGRLERWKERIQNGIENRAQAKFARLTRRPEKHIRAIRKEFDRAYSEATKSTRQDKSRARRDALQLTLYPLSHVLIFPTGINLVEIASIPLLHGIPLLANGVITTLFYNIPNTLQAITDRKIGKSLGYTLATALGVFPIPIPLVLNTITYDFALRPVDLRENKILLSHAQDVLSHPQNYEPAHYQAFAKAFADFTKRQKRRGSPMTKLQESLETATGQQISNQKDAEKRQTQRRFLTKAVHVYGNFRAQRLSAITDDKIATIGQLQDLFHAQKHTDQSGGYFRKKLEPIGRVYLEVVSSPTE